MFGIKNSKYFPEGMIVKFNSIANACEWHVFLYVYINFTIFSVSIFICFITLFTFPKGIYDGMKGLINIFKQYIMKTVFWNTWNKFSQFNIDINKITAVLFYLFNLSLAGTYNTFVRRRSKIVWNRTDSDSNNIFIYSLSYYFDYKNIPIYISQFFY